MLTQHYVPNSHPATLQLWSLCNYLGKSLAFHFPIQHFVEFYNGEWFFTRCCYAALWIAHTNYSNATMLGFQPSSPWKAFVAFAWCFSTSLSRKAGFDLLQELAWTSITGREEWGDFFLWRGSVWSNEEPWPGGGTDFFHRGLFPLFMIL